MRLRSPEKSPNIDLKNDGKWILWTHWGHVPGPWLCHRCVQHPKIPIFWLIKHLKVRIVLVSESRFFCNTLSMNMYQFDRNNYTVPTRTNDAWYMLKYTIPPYRHGNMTKDSKVLVNKYVFQDEYCYKLCYMSKRIYK